MSNPHHAPDLSLGLRIYLEKREDKTWPDGGPGGGEARGDRHKQVNKYIIANCDKFYKVSSVGSDSGNGI